MSQPFDKTDINLLDALSFVNDVRYRTPQQLMVGLETYLVTGMESDLPSRNAYYEKLMLARLGQLLASLRDRILYLESNAASHAWDAFYVIEYADLSSTTYLPFSNVDGMGRKPQTEQDYIFFKNGFPLTNGVSVNLTPGVGLTFTEAWESGDTGQMMITTSGFGYALRPYTFYGASFSGTGHTVANLAELGADITGASIDPLPTTSAELRILRPGLLTPNVSYTISFASGYPVVTFLSDIPADQLVHFFVLRAS